MHPPRKYRVRVWGDSQFLELLFVTDRHLRIRLLRRSVVRFKPPSATTRARSRAHRFLGETRRVGRLQTAKSNDKEHFNSCVVLRTSRLCPIKRCTHLSWPMMVPSSVMSKSPVSRARLSNLNAAVVSRHAQSQTNETISVPSTGHAVVCTCATDSSRLRCAALVFCASESRRQERVGGGRARGRMQQQHFSQSLTHRSTLSPRTLEGAW